MDCKVAAVVEVVGHMRRTGSLESELVPDDAEREGEERKEGSKEQDRNKGALKPFEAHMAPGALTIILVGSILRAVAMALIRLFLYLWER